MGRNKSMDESAYGDRWRKSVATCYETSQSNDSLLDMSPLDHQKSSSCAKSDIAFFNGLVIEELKSKSKSQHQGLDNSNFVSVAHIKLRDAKSEQNVSQQGLKPTTVIDLETSSTNYNNNNNNSSSVAQAAASHVNNNDKSKCESTAVTTTNSKTNITAQVRIIFKFYSLETRRESALSSCKRCDICIRVFQCYTVRRDQGL